MVAKVKDEYGRSDGAIRVHGASPGGAPLREGGRRESGKRSPR